jgi:hypothetical protein
VMVCEAGEGVEALACYQRLSEDNSRPGTIFTVLAQGEPSVRSHRATSRCSRM